MYANIGWRSILLWAAVLPLAAADIYSIIKSSGIDIEKKWTAGYTSILTNYWSAACGDLKPTCIATPSSAQDMAEIIKQLHDVDDLFAVRSGGHMPNSGFNSIHDGLLISTENMKQVFYNDHDQTAVIGPGLSWEDAQKALDNLHPGRALVGGRLGGVGVGGFMLGGGMSFLSSQYGWAANNVINYEVVLANGTIVNANKNENTDLFHALKGGGNNFGIVTAYTLETHPIGKVWGGNYVFDHKKTPQVLEAIRNFVDYYPDDKAAVIVTLERAAMLDTWIMFLFYDGPSPPKGVFDNFTDLGPFDTTKTWDSYYDLLKHNDQFILHGQRYVIGTETTPLPATPDILQEYLDHWYEVAESVLDVTGVIASIAFQPMPTAITSKARARGGDLIDLPDDQDYIIFELDFSYGFPMDDNKIDAALQQVYQGLNNIVNRLVKEGKLPDVYRPLFMNDAYHRQDYWGRLRTTEQALQTRLRYDPDGFFQKRTSGGFRLGK
ncbi:FAD binding domain-containing protein [Aspergillus sclerotialis]|uniref:FAD binding domain-containing protein n=1 Tax=Aspergillus sclerotialis TaxID=2070753 RepID=A0A3A2ZRF5_9EURO|nr:FAD binding domain-containing protein [Aspergillus sclerotialis]